MLPVRIDRRRELYDATIARTRLLEEKLGSWKGRAKASAPVSEGLLVVGRYCLVEKIGEGATATIWEARDERADGKEVALKILHSSLISDWEALKRFARGAIMSRVIDHPYVLKAFGEPAVWDGIAFYPMERLYGGDLRIRLERSGPLTSEHTVKILQAVLDAMGAFHAMYMVYRDLNTANVFLVGAQQADESVKLLDPDFAVESGWERAGPEAYMTGGTAFYMAPERTMPDRVTDHRADIYAAGVLAYVMLSGEYPFSAQNPYEQAQAHWNTRPQPLREWRPASSIPAWLDEAILKALEKDPDMRFQTAEEMRAALKIGKTDG